MIVKGFVRVEQLVPFEVEVDVEEYDEWREGDRSERVLIEYLKASPDWWEAMSIAPPSWKHEVTDYDIDTATPPSEGFGPVRAGAMPGGDAVCHGHHVWDEDECLRCGLIDRDYHRPTQSTDPDS